MNPDDRPEPPGLDLEALARELPFPPTWEERDAASPPLSPEAAAIVIALAGAYAELPPPQPRLDTAYLFGPDPIPRRRRPK